MQGRVDRGLTLALVALDEVPNSEAARHVSRDIVQCLYATSITHGMLFLKDSRLNAAF